MRKPYKKILISRDAARIRRKLGIRKKIDGSKERPRICVVTTNKHISVQVVDDTSDRTLFSVQTFGKKAVGSSSNKTSAELVGKEVATELKKRGIERAVFDRNGRLFGGKLSILADQIRNSGIQV